MFASNLGAVLLLSAVAAAEFFTSFDLPINDATATPSAASEGFAYDTDYKWIVSWGECLHACMRHKDC